MEITPESGQSSERGSDEAAYKEFIETMGRESELFERIGRLTAVESEPGWVRPAELDGLCREFEEAMNDSRMAFDRWRETMVQHQQAYREHEV